MVMKILHASRKQNRVYLPIRGDLWPYNMPEMRLRLGPWALLQELTMQGWGGRHPSPDALDAFGARFCSDLLKGLSHEFIIYVSNGTLNLTELNCSDKFCLQNMLATTATRLLIHPLVSDWILAH